MLDARLPNDIHQDLPAGTGAGQSLVLVIDADAASNAATAEVLRPHHLLACAFDALEGIRLALALQPDLVVVDAKLPGMGGEQLVSDLHRQTGLLGMPIVMLTDRGDRDQHLRLLRMGVQDCIDQPFVADELLARIAGLVDARRRALTERERYEQIVATSGDMLIFIDRQHRFVVANPAYADMYDRTPADLRRRPVEEILGPYNYAGIRNNLDRALAGESLRILAEPKLADGKRRVLDMVYRPFRRDGEVQGVVVSLRDVTSLKISEEAHKASEQRLQMAQDASGAGLWDLDLQNGRAYLTPQFYAMVGHEPQAEPPDFKFLERMVHPDDLQPMLDTIQAHLRGQIPSTLSEYRFVTPAGEIKWMRGEGRVVERDADGKPLRLIGMVIDISERKAEEKALRGQTDELAQRNDELERFNRASVGRELDMIELKKQVNALSLELGRDEPFPLAFLEESEFGALTSIL